MKLPHFKATDIITNGNFKAANDLSVFSNGVDATPDQIFVTGQVAFTGQATYDFSSTSASLPSSGTFGNVITGYWQSGPADHGEVIGQWSVVPEPLTFGLLLAGTLICGMRRRR